MLRDCFCSRYGILSFCAVRMSYACRGFRGLLGLKIKSEQNAKNKLTGEAEADSLEKFAQNVTRS